MLGTLRRHRNHTASRTLVSGDPSQTVHQAFARRSRETGIERIVDEGLDSRPGLLSAGVTFFRGNDDPFVLGRLS